MTTNYKEHKNKNTYFEVMRQRKEEKNWIDEYASGQGYCHVCGHNDPLDMEYHHIGAAANSDVLISLCRNCHGKLSRKQMKSWPEDWSLQKQAKEDENCPFVKRNLRPIDSCR